MERVKGQNHRENEVTGGTEPALRHPAQRALAEAEARRKIQQTTSRPVETGGRDGPDPVRFGDWEVKGLASDF